MRFNVIGPAMEAAACNGHVQVLEALSPLPLSHFKNAVVATAATGNVRVLELFIERAGGIDFLQGILEKAVELGNIGAVLRLAEKATESGIGRALTIAARSGQIEVARLLLEGYPSNERSIGQAIRYTSTDNCDLLKLLLDYAPSVGTRPTLLSLDANAEETWRPFMFHPVQEAIDMKFRSALEGGFDGAVNLLFDRSSLPTDDILECAVEHNQFVVMELVLDLCHVKQGGGDVLDEIVARLFEISATRGYIEMARLLADKCRDFNVGRALTIAVQSDSIEMINILLKISCLQARLDALVEAVLNEGVLVAHSDQETLSRAVSAIETTGKFELLQTILERCDLGTSSDNFRSAAKGGDVVTTQHFLSKMDDCSVVRALTSAAARGHVKVVKVLLDQADQTSMGYALLAAVLEGQLEVVDLLRGRCSAESICEACSIAKAAGFLNVAQILGSKKARLK